MANQAEQDSTQSTDIRVSTIKQIWSYATGMLALSVIFSNHPAPPVAVASGAAVATAVVWQGDKKSQNALQAKQLEKIEERLADLETIAGTNELDVHFRLKQLESRYHKDASNKERQY